MAPRTTHKITPNLWFDDQAEEAARFYASVFPGSEIGRITRYEGASAEVSGRPEGSAMTVEVQLAGQPFVLLNGGPQFQFTEAISFIVDCETQDEVDHYWDRLSAGGEEQPCGWLKDRYCVSWQIVPRILIELLRDPDPAKAQRVTKALLAMRKIDVAGLQRAYDQS